MYAPPNPAEAAALALQHARERLAADPPIAAHDFLPVNDTDIGGACSTVVAGAMCCRPRNHSCHKAVETPDRCDVCRQNRGSWLDCRCSKSCNSPCCRFANQDQFDWQSVPVPMFRKD